MTAPTPNAGEREARPPSEHLRTALALAAKGMRVFPCKVDKKPITPRGFHDATTDAEQIRRWWGDWRTASIGVATGAVSGFFVLDVDERHDGEASLRKLEAEHGELPATIEGLTGGGGRHLYFKYPADREIRNSTSKLGDGLDIRGDGGYVIAPPSGHPSGRPYQWSVDCAKAIAEAPQWLIELACSGRKRASGLNSHKGERGPAPFPLLEGVVTEGRRNDELARVAGLLFYRRCLCVDHVRTIVRSLNLTQCAPPLEGDEVDVIVDSILRREEAGHGRR